MSLIRTLN